jgi:hypothetical protein
MRYGRRSAAPTVEVGIAGRRELALIDSGAQYSVIDRSLFDALPPARRSLFDMPLVAYGVGGGAQMGRGTTLELGLPGLAVRGLRAAILDLGPLASEEGLRTRLIIGQDVLGEAVLALDPPRRHVRLIDRAAFVARRTWPPRRCGGSARPCTPRSPSKERCWRPWSTPAPRPCWA